jgi:hypothetical protein
VARSSGKEEVQEGKNRGVLGVLEYFFSQPFPVVAPADFTAAVASFVVDPGYSVYHKHHAGAVSRRGSTLRSAAFFGAALFSPSRKRHNSKSGDAASSRRPKRKAYWQLANALALAGAFAAPSILKKTGAAPFGETGRRSPTSRS